MRRLVTIKGSHPKMRVAGLIESRAGYMLPVTSYAVAGNRKIGQQRRGTVSTEICGPKIVIWILAGREMATPAQARD